MSTPRLLPVALFALAVVAPVSRGHADELCLPKKGKGNQQVFPECKTADGTMVPNDPFPGYMPPPLDGIWATAPYLHNGSVPTVELVLNSRARPRRWRRVDLDSRDLDETALGWPWIAVDTPQDELPEAERPLVYDTTYWSQSNAGHPFGEHLTDAERRAVIEYLKTL